MTGEWTSEPRAAAELQAKEMCTALIEIKRNLHAAPALSALDAPAAGGTGVIESVEQRATFVGPS